MLAFPPPLPGMPGTHSPSLAASRLPPAPPAPPALPEPPAVSPAADAEGSYEVNERGTWWRPPENECGRPVRLSNFAAEIAAELELDDGAEVRRQFEVRARLEGRELAFSVPAARFAAMEWVAEELGASAVIFAGKGRRDRLRCAVQVLSKNVERRRVFAHSGWRELEGRWVYLHGGGALGAEGAVERLEVELPAALRDLRLPAPSSGAELAADIGESLGLLDLAPRAVTLPLLAATYRAAAGGTDFSVHLAGPSGAGKTELAALCQQHYGPRLGARRLPGSWSSTPNALELLAFAAKDSLLVVDDFCPRGGRQEVLRLNAAADRLLRAQGNAAGRLRMTGAAALGVARPPRGLLLSTGEDSPRGYSLRARLVLLAIAPGDLRWGELGRSQRAAAEGACARALAGFIVWLAARRDEALGALLRRTAELRDAGSAAPAGHRRSQGNVAGLIAGWELFLRFAAERGALDARRAEELEAEGREVLGGLAEAQAGELEAEEPAARFLELLRAALASGRAHIAAPDGGPPAGPEAWGWRRQGPEGAAPWAPQGERLGWLDEGGWLSLQAEAAYAAAERLGTSEGGSLGIGVRAAVRRLEEGGFLARREGSRATTRILAEGKQFRVIRLRAETIHPSSS
jgi:hypothetical protein